MKHALKSIACPRSSSASVVDGKLILSFPDALTPVVWQMDLTQAKASALEVREGKDKGTFTLTLKNPKDETVEIATFEKRERAVGGLMAASKALSSAHGNIRPVTTNTSAPATLQQPKGKKLPILLGIILLAALFLVWANLKTNMSGGLQTGLNPASTTSAPADTVGVPVSADDFLSGR